MSDVGGGLMVQGWARNALTYTHAVPSQAQTGRLGSWRSSRPQRHLLLEAHDPAYEFGHGAR